MLLLRADGCCLDFFFLLFWQPKRTVGEKFYFRNKDIDFVVCILKFLFLFFLGSAINGSTPLAAGRVRRCTATSCDVRRRADEMLAARFFKVNPMGPFTFDAE